MSDLTIKVDPVPDFLGYPLAFAIDEPKEGLLHQGAVRVGETLTIPLDKADQYRVRLLLPNPTLGWKTLVAIVPPDRTVTFRIADELLAARQHTIAGAAPYVLLPPAETGILASGVSSEFVPVSSDPFSMGSPLLDANLMMSQATGTPVPQRESRPPLHTLMTPRAAEFRAARHAGARFVVRPFVRLWRVMLGETSWRVDPDTSARLKDTDDGLREVEVLAGTRCCLEVGTPSGPNQFVYLPPGLVSAQLRALEVPAIGGGPSGVELAVRSEQDANLLLALTRGGALAEGRSVAALADPAPQAPRGSNSNSALVLAYFFLRNLELDRAAQWLDIVAKENPHWPDNRVIQGWRELRAETPGLEAAQAAFIAAGKDVGPPAYTEGLRLLLDGFELFHYAPDVTKLPHFEQAFLRVRQWGGAADWEQTLTTLSGDRPDAQRPGARVPFLLRELFPLF